MRTLFGLAILAILHFSLFPWHFDALLFAQRSFRWLSFSDPSDWTDIVLNLFFYTLPALLGQWAFSPPQTPKPFRTLLAVVTGLTLLSLTLEILQLGIPTRHANPRDTLCNAIGALLGASLGALLPSPSRLLANFKLPPQGGSLVLFFIVFTTWQTFPFLPYLRLYRLVTLHHPFLHPSWSLTEILDVFFALLVLHLIAYHLHLPAFRFTLAAALLLPAQAFLRDVELSPSRLAAAAFALLAAATVLRRPQRIHFFSLATLLSCWLLARQLAPANFATHPIHSFTWIPFTTLIESSRTNSVRTLANKFFLYGGAIWLWLSIGLSLRLATLAIFLLLALTEFLQLFLPGRTPETTDLLLALLAACLLHLTQNGEPTHQPPVLTGG